MSTNTDGAVVGVKLKESVVFILISITVLSCVQQRIQQHRRRTNGWKKIRVAKNKEVAKWMRKAIQLAWKSNPVESAYCVGCVLVDPETDECVSTGYSREIKGNTHAEECALRKYRQNNRANKMLDMYTTMEPCSERLSGNIPCCSNIIGSNLVRRVYVGAAEPEALVLCHGVRILQEAGIEVLSLHDEGRILKEDCLAPNAHILSGTSSSFRTRGIQSTDYSKIRSIVDSVEKAPKYTHFSIGSINSSFLASLEQESNKNEITSCIIEKVLPTKDKVKAAADTQSVIGFAILNCTGSVCNLDAMFLQLRKSKQIVEALQSLETYAKCIDKTTLIIRDRESELLPCTISILENCDYLRIYSDLEQLEEAQSSAVLHFKKDL